MITVKFRAASKPGVDPHTTMVTMAVGPFMRP
jgi:hypothetical protein